jgi:dTDP-4-amino-4,6-dideoxygalactose transaminase
MAFLRQFNLYGKQRSNEPHKIKEVVMAYKVRFVDYPAQYHSMESEIDTAIKEILSKGDLILREQLKQFESNIASITGADYAVGVNSGTDALYLSLRAAEVGAGDEVITVAHTFVATVAVIVHCGARPILIDVSEDYNMNMELMEQAITSRTKAIVPVHLNGRLCDMENLMRITAKHNLIVIEDAAQALGATFNGQKAGSFGLAGCFSFYPAKIIGAAGEAGIVTTNDSQLAEKIFLLRDHGRKSKNELACFGFNSRLDNLQAAILNVKLKYLDRWIERRREIARMYHQGLSGIPGLKLPPPPQDNGQYFDVFTYYVIQSNRRDELVAHLNEDGIEIIVSWPKPMHHHPALGLGHFRLPQTEKISREVLSLPLNTELTNEQVDYVIESVRRFYGM